MRKSGDLNSPEARPFFMRGGDHGVLLLHGFTGMPAHMRLIGEGLNERGFTVEGICLPGHGTKMEDMLSVTWEDYLRAAKDAFTEMKKSCRLVSVAGLSLGGCLTLMIAEQSDPTAIATISAPMAVRNRMLPLARFAAPFLPVIHWPARKETDERLRLDPRCDIGYTGFPTRSAVQLSKAIRESRRNLSAVTCPILVIQSDADETIAPESAEVILSGVASEVKGRMELHGVPHVCTISCEAERIVEGLAELFHRADPLSGNDNMQG